MGAQSEGTFNLLAPAYSHRAPIRGTGIVQNLHRTISGRQSQDFAWPSCRAAINRLSIPWRLGLLVLALALPLNLIVLGAIWGLVNQASDTHRTSLLYAAQSIAAGVDAKLAKYIMLAEALARSPALLDDNLKVFETEARRDFPAGGRAWVLVADVNGQQLVNTLAEPGEPLPTRNPLGTEAQQRAFATGNTVTSDVLFGKVSQDWIINIEVPIFRNGQPFRVVVVGIRTQEFLPLLSVRDIPKNWLVGIMDGQGRFIARGPKGKTEVGQLASQGWRATKGRTGVFEYPSLEGDALITANALPSISSWTVGVAVKKAELQAVAWSTVRWAVISGAGLVAASLLLAAMLARQITRPINQLRQSFADFSVAPGKPIVVGPPEIMELQDTLYYAAAERQKSNQALMGTLSKLEHEMALREDAQAALAHSQRMEAVGQLAGGMAHDSNNVLAAISANVDVAMLRSSDEKIFARPCKTRWMRSRWARASIAACSLFPVSTASNWRGSTLMIASLGQPRRREANARRSGDCH